MADIKQYPPRQATLKIDLYYRDLANLMKQAVESPEVLTFLTEEEMKRMIENLHGELNSRENRGEQ